MDRVLKSNEVYIQGTRNPAVEAINLICGAACVILQRIFRHIITLLVYISFIRSARGSCHSLQVVKMIFFFHGIIFVQFCANTRELTHSVNDFL